MTGLEIRLDGSIFELSTATDHSTAHRRCLHLTIGIEGKLPDRGGAILAGQERAVPFRQAERVERGALVGGVEGHGADAGLFVEGTSRADEGGDVGHRIPKEKTAWRALEVDGLVEVHRPGRVQGHEWDVGEIRLRHPRRSLGLLLCLGWIVLGNLEFVPNRLQPGPHLLVGRDKPKHSLRHRLMLRIG